MLFDTSWRCSGSGASTSANTLTRTNTTMMTAPSSPNGFSRTRR